MYGWKAVASAGLHAGSSYYCTWQGRINLLMVLLLFQDRAKVLFLKGKGSKHCLAPWNEEDLNSPALRQCLFWPCTQALGTKTQQTIKPVAKEVLPTVQGQPNGCTVSGSAHCPRVLPLLKPGMQGKEKPHHERSLTPPQSPGAVFWLSFHISISQAKPFLLLVAYI